MSFHGLPSSATALDELMLMAFGAEVKGGRWKRTILGHIWAGFVRTGPRE